MTRAQLARHVVNTLTGINLFGWLVGVFLRGRPQWDSRYGLLVFVECRLPLRDLWASGPPAAVTFGDVVLVLTTNPQWCSVQGIPESIMRHEAAHSRQYMFTLGLPYFPLYWVCCLYSYIRSGNYWAFNPFEVRAGLANGGYREKPSA